MSSPRVSVNLFLEAWASECLVQGESLRATWSSSPSLTARMLTESGSIVRRVAARLTLQSYMEYYHTDAVFFSESDRVLVAPKDQTWLHRIRVALEHEITFGSKLFEEVSHLMLVDADLRVLITYSPERVSTLKRHMDVLHSVVAASDKQHLFSCEGSLLAIVGWRNFVEDRVYWRPDVYESSGWQSLSDLVT